MTGPIQSNPNNTQETSSTESITTSSPQSSNQTVEVATLNSLLIGAEIATRYAEEGNSEAEVSSTETQATTVDITAVETKEGSSGGETGGEETSGETPPDETTGTGGTRPSSGLKAEEEEEEDILSISSITNQQAIHRALGVRDRAVEASRMDTSSNIKALLGDLKTTELGLSTSTINIASFSFNEALKASEKLHGMPSGALADSLATSVKTNLTKGYTAIFSELVMNPEKLEAMLAKTLSPLASSTLGSAIKDMSTGALPIAGLSKNQGTTSETDSLTSWQLIGLLAGFAADQSDNLVSAADYNAEVSQSAAKIGEDSISMANQQLTNLEKQIEEMEAARRRADRMGGFLQEITMAVQVIAITAMVIGGAAMIATGAGAVAGGIMIGMAVMMATQMAASAATNGKSDNFVIEQMAIGMAKGGLISKEDARLLAAALLIVAVTVATAGIGGVGMGISGSALMLTTASAAFTAASMTGFWSETAAFSAREGNMSEEDEMILNITLNTAGALAAAGTSIGASSASAAQASAKAAELSKTAATAATAAQTADDAARTMDDAARVLDDAAKTAKTNATNLRTAADAAKTADDAGSTTQTASKAAETAKAADDAEKAAKTAETSAEAAKTSAKELSTGAQKAAAEADEAKRVADLASQSASLVPSSMTSMLQSTGKWVGLAGALAQFGGGIAIGVTQIQLGTIQAKMADLTEEIGRDQATLNFLQDIAVSQSTHAQRLSESYGEFVKSFSEGMSSSQQTMAEGYKALADVLQG